MRYFVQTRSDSVSKELTDKFHRLAAERGLQCDEQTPEIVVSIGGDGTMLHAFHRYIERLDEIAFVGIHTGHLGFYADWQATELEDLVDLMSGVKKSDLLSPRIVKYPLVELEIHTDSGVRKYLALNEFTVRGIDGTIVAQIDINDQLFEMFRGDGICVSTPSGSTAYNKSLGGAMLHPSIEALQLAEIASINNRVYRTLGSSLILPNHHHCDIYPRNEQRLLLTVDHLSVPLGNLHYVRCSVAKQKVSFARYRPYPFWNRVRRAFIGYENTED
ncbi:NAD kinase 1 [Paenibacillus sp. CECT 9249]|uniref:NAD kinase n=1 Tax=Paenibacillus sp. CECT 9249 TaxID=2845385 RepID=UPI001E2F9170|nr:NAD kinase [Paenibacillus sp. CECT 9249]CAH0118293.1 NAD kinase 1 [Paenibacillus sp. CECT 9249]